MYQSRALETPLPFARENKGINYARIDAVIQSAPRFVKFKSAAITAGDISAPDFIDSPGNYARGSHTRRRASRANGR